MAVQGMSHKEVKSICDELECSPGGKVKVGGGSPIGATRKYASGGKASAGQHTSGFMGTPESSGSSVPKMKHPKQAK